MEKNNIELESEKEKMELERNKYINDEENIRQKIMGEQKEEMDKKDELIKKIRKEKEDLEKLGKEEIEKLKRDLNRLLSYINWYLHSSKCFLQYIMYIQRRVADTIISKKLYRINLSALET